MLSLQISFFGKRVSEEDNTAGKPFLRRFVADWGDVRPSRSSFLGFFHSVVGSGTGRFLGVGKLTVHAATAGFLLVWVGTGGVGRCAEEVPPPARFFMRENARYARMAPI